MAERIERRTRIDTLTPQRHRKGTTWTVYYLETERDGCTNGALTGLGTPRTPTVLTGEGATSPRCSDREGIKPFQPVERKLFPPYG